MRALGGGQGFSDRAQLPRPYRRRPGLFFRGNGSLPNVFLHVPTLKSELFPDVDGGDFSQGDKAPESCPAYVQPGHDLFDGHQFLGGGAHLEAIL